MLVQGEQHEVLQLSTTADYLRMCTEREVVRESMAASPSETDLAMEMDVQPVATVLEKIPENSRPLGYNRTPSRMPSKSLMRSSSTPELKPEAKKRVPSPGPRERPINPPAAEEKPGLDVARHTGKPSSSPQFVSTHLHPSAAVVKAPAVPSTQGRASPSPASLSVKSVSDTVSSSVPEQFSKFSSLMNQLARSSSQSASTGLSANKTVSPDNRSLAPSPGLSKPPSLSSLKERTRSAQVPPPSPSDTKPRLFASTEPRTETSSLTSSLVPRPSSPSRTGVKLASFLPVVSSSNSNKVIRVPSPSRTYSRSSVSSPSVCRPSTPTITNAPPSVIPKPRTSTPSRTNSTPDPWTSSRSGGAQISTGSAVPHSQSTSAASRPSSPSRFPKPSGSSSSSAAPIHVTIRPASPSRPVSTNSSGTFASSRTAVKSLTTQPAAPVHVANFSHPSSHLLSPISARNVASVSQPVAKSPSPSSSSHLASRSGIAEPSSSPAATTLNSPFTPTRSLTKATKSPTPSSLILAHQKQPSSFPSMSFANLQTVGSAAMTSQNNARGSSPLESPKSTTSNGDCSNSDTSSSTSSGNLATTRKSRPEFQPQQQQQLQQKAGCKHSQASHKTSVCVVPEGLPLSPTSNVKKRCGWITSQSDVALIAYHDEEWGIPIYDEKLLFELIVLAGAQGELSWSSILGLRDDFRDAFAGFDPAVVAKFNEKKIATLLANPRIRISEAKIRGPIDNAKQVLEIAEECGSLTNFLWSFVNYKPMVSHYKLSKQVPVKTPKSEAISNELVRRGLRFVGPTTIYVLMQAAGLVNDHLVTCFRHQECASMYDSPPPTSLYKEIQPEKERWIQTDDNLSYFSSCFSSKTPPAFEPGSWLNLPALDISSRLNSAPCEPFWAELPMIEEAFEDEIEKQTT